MKILKSRLLAVVAQVSFPVAKVVPSLGSAVGGLATGSDTRWCVGSELGGGGRRVDGLTVCVALLFCLGASKVDDGGKSGRGREGDRGFASRLGGGDVACLLGDRRDGAGNGAGGSAGCEGRHVLIRRSQSLRVVRVLRPVERKQTTGGMDGKARLRREALIEWLRASIRYSDGTLGGGRERQHTSTSVVKLLVNDGPESLPLGSLLGLTFVVDLDPLRQEGGGSAVLCPPDGGGAGSRKKPKFWQDIDLGCCCRLG